MARKGDRYKCDECGLLVIVEDDCGCSSCDLICCGEPMKSVKASKEKPRVKK